MKIKKTVVSVFCLFFLAMTAIHANQIFFFKTSAGFDIDKDGLFPSGKAGIFFTTDTCSGELGGVMGMLDVRAFCDYKFKFWPGDVYKSNLEPGVMAGFMFCSFGFVPVWHIEDNSWDFCYRVGYRFGSCDLDRANSFFGKHCGLELEAYFQAPFDDPESFDFVMAASLLISPFSRYYW